MDRIYLDNNATTAVDPDVVAAMLPYFRECYANASSSHGPGEEAASAVRTARGQVAALLGAGSEQEIVFTSGGTESDAAAILSALDMPAAPCGGAPQRNELIVSAVEHPAVLALADHLAKARGVTVHRIPVDARGRLDLDAYRVALGPRTALVSMMWANNETGSLFPVVMLAQMAHAAGALFHTDAVQAAGKVAIDLGDSAIDMLSLSGHKLHGPKGIGALYVRKGVRFNPLLHGGHQERGRRAGTENVPAIAGLGKAAELAAVRLCEDTRKMRDLRDRLEQGIAQRITDTLVNGDTDARLPNTSNIAFDLAESEIILQGLDRAGIAASSGSACASGSMEPSHVLRAMAVPYTAIHGAVRFSLSRETSGADVERVLAVLPDIVAKAREASLFASPPAGDPHTAETAADPNFA